MEGLVASGTSILATGLAVGGYLMIGKSYQASEKSFRSSQLGYKWSRTITVDIEEAKSAEMPDENTLVLEHANPISNENQTVTYSISNGEAGRKNLVRTVDGEADSRFSASLSTVSFELPSSSSVKFRFTSAQTANQEMIKYSAQVKMRNFK